MARQLILLFTAVLFLGCSGGDSPSTLPDTSTTEPAPVEITLPDGEPLQATLFFLTPATNKLQPVMASIPPFKTREEGILKLLEIYTAMAPPESLISPLPSGMKPRAVYFPEVGLCVVDITLQARDDAGSGSSEEKTMVYAIVNTVALNFSDIRSVKILLNGKEASGTITHLDASAFFKPRPGS